MTIRPIKTRIFKEDENLFDFIVQHVKKIPEKSVIAVTSKIIALSENRTSIIKNSTTKKELMRKESDFMMPTKYVWLTIKNGSIMASAGIDESNANGKLILLPNDCFKTAHFLRKNLQKKFKVKELGVLITDSRTVPLRLGVTGVALGYAGFRGVKSYVGAPDIFGRKFKFSRTNIADSLATSSVLVMGEGNEQQPLAIIEKPPIKFCDRINKNELRIDIKDDMYLPILSKLKKI
jgi:F420-0:gamma-glutamyl ligase